TAGEIDQITVTLSEDIDGATLDTDGGSDDFTVTGYTVTSVAANGSDGAIITLTESLTPDTGVTPNIDLGIGDIEDMAASKNSLAAVQTFSSTSDGAAPVLLSSSPSDEDIDVSVSGNITLTFSENVQAGTGDGDVTLVDVTNGTDTRTITLPDGQLVFSTNTLTIN
ncbi:MAG: Ig-like domain-containing protein, partial [Delftia sp.]|nr:Ig-like domain-containing protein [Delftia sp.]